MRQARHTDPLYLATLTDEERSRINAERAAKTYKGKIAHAIRRYEDPLDRELVELLTAPQTIGVLRGLDAKVRSLSDQFETAEEREVALRILRDGFAFELADLATVVHGIAIQP